MAIVVAVALVAAQVLGLLHRTVHADDSAIAALPSFATAHADADSHGGWIDALFSGHHAARDCVAFDQMGHADLATFPGAVPVPPPLPSGNQMQPRNGARHVAAQACGFLARGPPVSA